MTARDPVAPVDGATQVFLFSDIEGSTRIEEAIGTAAYAALRERHRAILRSAFTAKDGVEHGTEGDSFFVVFRTAADALGAAADAQRALRSEPWPEDAAIRVRMGLNAGTAASMGGSLVGLAINRAARIAAVAHGSQVLVSDAVRGLTGGMLPEGLRLVDLGVHRLRDLREPERICQLAGPGLEFSFPPLATVDARPNNLPTQLTSFVGRDTETAAVLLLLESNRLVTLTGPGGTGKTRLSLQVAAMAMNDHPDGTFFVALETVRDAGLVASRIVGEIGLSEAGGRSAHDILVEWIGDKHVLLVLDNFEQVADGGPVIADILRAAPGLTVIATSRAPLRISGEQEFPVPGLPVPPDPARMGGYDRARLGGAAGPDLAVLNTYEAVRLFVARAVSVRPDFAVTNANAPAVAAICARLQGLPLAIELAAARVKLLSPDAILGRLEHQLNLLASGARDLPARQQTLRGAIAWSYDILDDADQRLLERLSVFSGGFDLEAADAIAGSYAETGRDVLDGLTVLADQSLLRSAGEDPPRFQLLETIREFAAEMLDRREDVAAIQRRHTAWFVELVESASAGLSGPDQRELLSHLEREHDNIRAALDRTAAAGDGTAIRLAFAMWRFWQKRGHLNEARRRLESLAAQPWTRDDRMLRARLMEALGGVLWWQADIEPMGTAYAEALEIWRELGNQAEIANALYNYSFSFAVGPDPSLDPSKADPDGKGFAAQHEAYAIYREIGDIRGQANVVWGIGNAEYFQVVGDLGEARFGEALDLFRSVNDVTMEAWSLHMLGSALLRQKRPGEAGDYLRGALRLFHQASDAAGIALVFDDLHSEAVGHGDLERAARIYGAARRLTATTGAELAGFVDTRFEHQFRPHISGRLPGAEIERLAAEGAALSLDEAVAYALEASADAHGAGVRGTGRSG